MKPKVTACRRRFTLGLDLSVNYPIFNSHDGVAGIVFILWVTVAKCAPGDTHRGGVGSFAGYVEIVIASPFALKCTRVMFGLKWQRRLGKEGVEPGVKVYRESLNRGKQFACLICVNSSAEKYTTPHYVINRRTLTKRPSKTRLAAVPDWKAAALDRGIQTISTCSYEALVTQVWTL